MSYDISLTDPVTGETLQTPEPHGLRGGTYALGDTNAELNITYNYSDFYYKHLDSDKGIRILYGMTGEEAIPILTKAIAVLGIIRDRDYWRPTPGNAGAALLDLLTLAKKFPQGVFRGD